MSRRIAIEIEAVLACPDAERANREAAGDYWAGLDEREPQIVSRLAEIAKARQWEIIFLTSVQSNHGTAQIDAQRWLESKGFAFPSVFVAPGSRGRIASALNLDIVIGGSPEHCREVAAQSAARAILVWPPDRSLPVDTSRPQFDIVKSVSACLDVLAVDEDIPRETGWFRWARRLFGLKDAKA